MENKNKSSSRPRYFHFPTDNENATGTTKSSLVAENSQVQSADLRKTLFEDVLTDTHPPAASCLMFQLNLEQVNPVLQPFKHDTCN